MTVLITLNFLVLLGVLIRNIFFQTQPNIISGVEALGVALFSSLFYQSTLTLNLIQTIKEQGVRAFALTPVFYLLFWILRGLLKKGMAGFLFTLLLFLITLGNILKYNTRKEPLLWSDLTGGLSLIKGVLWDMLIQDYFVWFLIVLLIISSCLFFLFKKDRDTFTWKQRVISVLLPLVFLFGFLNQPNAILKRMGILIYPNNKSVNLQKNGPGLVFLFSKEGTTMSTPAGYNKKKMEEIISTLKQTYPDSKKDKITKETPTFIYILSEAFSDPTLIQGTQWVKDPIPTIRNLQKESGGNMLVNIFGGGTANTEFSVLTNFSHELLDDGSIPYTYFSENKGRAFSVVNTLKKENYETLAIHPYYKNAYNRENVYEQLGFTNFVDLQNFYDTGYASFEEAYVSDSSFYDMILSKLNDQPQFIQSMSMQNHYSYTPQKKGNLLDSENLLKNKTDITGSDQLALYTRGLNKTDEATKVFIEQLKKQDKEIYVVFYGDHYPALDESFYQSNSVTSNTNQELATRSVPYFIWNNKGKKIETPRVANPEFISLFALHSGQQLNSLFQKFTFDLGEHLNAYDIALDVAFVNNDEQKFTSLPSDVKKELEKYQMIMYDILSGHQYSKTLLE